MLSKRMWLAGAAISALLGTANARADQDFYALINAEQVQARVSTSTETGMAWFTLNEAQTELAYTIQLNDLNLKADAGDRTDPKDVTAIHMHLHVPGVTGPHVLNIFGLPGMDDDDLLIDYENATLSGIFDESDSIDPDTGEPYLIIDPLVTKPLSLYLNYLLDEQLYVAIHTVQSGGSATMPGLVDLRGNILQVPEPSALVLTALLALMASAVSSRCRLS